jgi:hypothetical protein
MTVMKGLRAERLLIKLLDAANMDCNVDDRNFTTNTATSETHESFDSKKPSAA